MRVENVRCFYFILFVLFSHKNVARWVTFVYLGVDLYHSEDPFVCFGAKPTQRACTRDYPRDQKRAREGKVLGRQGPRTEHRRKQSIEQGSRQNRAVSRRDQSTEVGRNRRSEKGHCSDL